MRPLSRGSSGRRGEVLSVPWPALEEYEIRLGDAVTVLGAPGTNKSNLLLNWLLRSNIPAIYGSFDTPLTDMTARSLSILSGDPVDDVFEEMGRGTYAKWADECLSLWFTDETNCLRADDDGLTLLDDMALAYEEFFGDMPKVIVLDNLSDVAGDVHHEPLQRTFKAARAVASRMGAAVFCLHHVRRPGDEGAKDPWSVPVRLNDGVGAGERDAAVVLGLWKPRYGDGHVLRIAHLKNKRKEANPAGAMYLDFELDEAKAWIGDQVA